MSDEEQIFETTSTATYPKTRSAATRTSANTAQVVTAAVTTPVAII